MSINVPQGEPLWTTDNKPVSGAELLYGIEVEDEIKKKYKKYNLNE